MKTQPEIEWPKFKMRWQFLLAGSLLAGLAYLAFKGYVFDFHQFNPLDCEYPLFPAWIP